jgi:hypothetical protein
VTFPADVILNGFCEAAAETIAALPEVYRNRAPFVFFRGMMDVTPFTSP